MGEFGLFLFVLAVPKTNADKNHHPTKNNTHKPIFTSSEYILTNVSIFFSIFGSTYVFAIFLAYFRVHAVYVGTFFNAFTTPSIYSSGTTSYFTDKNAAKTNATSAFKPLFSSRLLA